MIKKINKLRELNGALLATIFGIATSLCTAYAVLDFDALDFSMAKTWFKLVVVGLPAIGGYMSTLSKPKK